MKRTFLAVAVVLASLAAVFCLGIDGGSCQEEQPCAKRFELAMNFPSPQVSWDSESKYVMTWDEASKKLLFNDRAISHGTVTRVCMRFNGVNITNPADDGATPSHPDEYSFDVGTIGDPGVSSDSNKEDGRLCYSIRWDDSKETFTYHEPRPGPIPEVQLSFTRDECVSDLQIFWKAHNAEAFPRLK